MPYLSELERGRKEASSEVLAAVCDALRIELSDLLAEAGRRTSPTSARAAPSSRSAPAAANSARANSRRTSPNAPPESRPRDKAGASARRIARPGFRDRTAHVPVVVPLDAVRSRRIPSAGGAPGDAQALAA